MASRELRVAAVFNGGVSLAVWMGGVTHELNLVRLACEPVADGQSPPVTDAWAKILDACGRSVSIDLLGGTSAGGLNGSLLATAVARGNDLSTMRDLWLNLPSLDPGALTRDYGGNGRAEDPAPTSVLSGKYFLDSIRTEFEKLKSSPARRRNCKLLVTATALSSPATKTTFSDGDSMVSVDGRRVYRFERDGDAPDHDDFENHAEALGLAARASASFPGAFAPVPESLELKNRRNTADMSHATLLADGGILDNAPFEPVLEAIRAAPLGEPSDRLLLYITPAIDVPVDTGKDVDENAEQPPLTKVLKWVVSAMREPDQRLDRQAMDESFGLMSLSPSQPFVVLNNYLQAPALFVHEHEKPLHDAAVALFDRYRTNRAVALASFLTDRDGTQSAPKLPPGTKRPTIAPERSDRLPDNLARLLPGSISNLTPGSDDRWVWGLSTAQRILRWWTEALNILSPPTDDVDVTIAMQTANDALAWTLQRWDEMVELVRGSTESPMTRDQQLDAMAKFYFWGDNSVAVQLGRKVYAAAEAVARVDRELSPGTLLGLSLSIEVISGTFDWSGDEFDTPVFQYAHITPAGPPQTTQPTPRDMALDEPLIDMSGLGKNWATGKLYGERWGHFGAFTGRMQRQHDWLWGRIDGADQLSRHLLRSSTADADKIRDLRTGLKIAILESENVSERDVRRGARDVLLVTPMVLARRMIDGERGMATLRNLIQTLLLMNQPSGSAGRIAWSLLTPYFPRRREKQWSELLVGIAAVLWFLTLPLRWVLLVSVRCLIRGAARRSIKAAAKAKRASEDAAIAAMTNGSAT